MHWKLTGNNIHKLVNIKFFSFGHLSLSLRKMCSFVDNPKSKQKNILGFQIKSDIVTESMCFP